MNFTIEFDALGLCLSSYRICKKKEEGEKKRKLRNATYQELNNRMIKKLNYMDEICYGSHN